MEAPRCDQQRGADSKTDQNNCSSVSSNPRHPSQGLSEDVATSRALTADEIDGEIAAFSSALAVMTGNVGETKERRIRIRTASETGGHCGACGEAFAEDAVIYRRTLSQGQMISGWSTVVAPVCEAHAAFGSRSYLKAVPCAGCGRLVRNERSFRGRRRIVCSEQCAAKARHAESRNRRTEARGTRSCEVCNETFEPPRSDAKFCSGACRQKAYRRRVTDAEHVTMDMPKSRNALRMSNTAPASCSGAVTAGGAP